MGLANTVGGSIVSLRGSVESKLSCMGSLPEAFRVDFCKGLVDALIS